MRIDFLTCSKRNPGELNRLLGEMETVIDHENERQLLVLTSEEDISKENLEKYRENIIFQEPRGTNVALHAGFLHSDAEWVVWLNDDIHFLYPHWLDQLKEAIHDNPEIKVFGLQENRGKNKGVNINKHCSFGACPREYYFKHYSTQPYIKYFWDNDILDISTEEGVFKQTSIELDHYWNRDRSDREIYLQDEEVYNQRRIERCFPNIMVKTYFKSRVTAKGIALEIPGAYIKEDKDKFLILRD